jgi:hypothetical protein
MIKCDRHWSGASRFLRTRLCTTRKIGCSDWLLSPQPQLATVAPILVNINVRVPDVHAWSSLVKLYRSAGMMICFSFRSFRLAHVLVDILSTNLASSVSPSLARYRHFKFLLAYSFSLFCPFCRKFCTIWSMTQCTVSLDRFG